MLFRSQVRVDHPLLRGGVTALDALREVDLVGSREQLVPAGGVHEELERVERAGRGRHGALGGLLGAHDDVALLERGAEAGEVVLAQLMLVRKRLDVLLLDETALGGLLEQALDGGEIVQVNGVAQLMFLSLMVGGRISAPRAA